MNSLEFIRINKPQFFIFENVKGLLSHDKKEKSAIYGRTFNEWANYLGGKSVNGNETIFPYQDSVPYHIYYKVLNAKHYGIPQNRERIFIIGIRDDENNNYHWPKAFPLKKQLKDVLENEVDEKYFLSINMLNMLNSHADRHNEKGTGFSVIYKNENSLANTIRANGALCPTDNILKLGFINQDSQASQVFDESGIAPTIAAGTHGVAMGYVKGDLNQIGSLYPDNSDAGRIYDSSGISCTIKAEGGGMGAKTGLYEVDSELLTETNHQNMLILGYTRDNKGKVTSRHKKNIANTIHTSTGSGGNTDQFPISNKRIRRLTPRECFRLMDFPEDFKITVSDTQAYKQAGNSIVVEPLALIIAKLLKIHYHPKQL